jgi:capsular exopolysaccharide synthesis family protein
MSRNFELLQRAEKEDQLEQPSVRPAPPTDGNRSRLKLEALTREEALKLVQRVFFSPNAHGPRAVVFSGVEHGAGSSWVCARTCETLAAQAVGSVCVVDANLRSPSLHRYFDVENCCGLTDSLPQPGPIRNFAQRLGGGNLWLMPCGASTADAHTFLKSDRMQKRLADLRAAFDYVLIDTPPVNLYADAIALGQLADGVILVVEANATRREAARKAKESLDAANVRVLGAVLNKRTFPIPESLYRKI